MTNMVILKGRELESGEEREKKKQNGGERK